MDKSTCPYLGTLDQYNNQKPGINYPSFENRCFAAVEYTDTSLVLADQATYCLSGGYHHCPRYQSTHLRTSSPIGLEFSTASSLDIDPLGPETIGSPSLKTDPYNSGIAEPDFLTSDLMPITDDPFKGTPPFGSRQFTGRGQLWMAAVALFAVVFLCGIGVTFYTGWQLVNQNLLASRRAPGQINSISSTLSTPVQAASPEVYIVMTATSETNAAAPPLQPVVEQPSGQTMAIIAATPTTDFPVAVHPTPVPPSVHSNGQPAVNVQPVVVAVAPTAAPQPQNLPVVIPTPTPAINVQIPLPPARRAAPEVEIVIATPTPSEPTPIPTATFGPPIVIFGSTDKKLEKDECTIISWEVANVQAVYYESSGVDGKGSREVCIDEESEDYNLTVILPNGVAQVYTTTVEYLEPTATPEPTASFTPEPDPTSTWTPQPPPPTFTPNIRYGTTLAVKNGTSQTCNIGQQCAIELLVTNTGDQPDTLAVVVVEQGPWTPQLCRLDGVCSNTKLLISNVGPGNIAIVTLTLDIPVETSRQTTTYVFQSSSENSGGVIVSETVTLQIEAK